MQISGWGLFVGVLCSVSVTVGTELVRAQNPASPSQVSGSPSDQIKATGCLAKDPSGKFLLNNASIETAPWASAAPGAKEAVTPAPQASKTAFVLQNGVNLQNQVGKRVEVTGKVAPASANVAPDSPDIVIPPPSTEQPGRGTAGGRGGGTQRTYLPALAVQSVRTIGQTCS